MNVLIETNHEEVAGLCRSFRVERLELFGSAAGDAFDLSRSDLDFLVAFQPCSPEKHAECYLGLLAALQDLFGLDVDLVELEAVHNPYFLEDIETTRTLVYAET